MKRPVTVKRVCYILSYVVGIGVPVWAVMEKFPVWSREYSPAKSAGIGLLLIACIVVAVGRKVIVPAIAKWLGGLSAGSRLRLEPDCLPESRYGFTIHCKFCMTSEPFASPVASAFPLPPQ